MNNININKLYETYLTLKDDDSPKDIELINYIIEHKLTEPERNIILLYAELNSLRNVAEYLHASYCVTHKTIKKIQNKICYYYNFYTSR